MGHLLAIDAGTGGCRAVVFSDEGRPLAGARRRWTHAADPDQPGSVDFDTRAAWALISDCVRDSLADVRAGDVRAVSATSVRGGLVLFDAAGDELWACGSTDARATDQVRWVRRRDPGFEAEAYRSSGQTLAMAALPRLLWLRDRLPRVYEAASTPRWRHPGQARAVGDHGIALVQDARRRQLRHLRGHRGRDLRVRVADHRRPGRARHGVEVLAPIGVPGARCRHARRSHSGRAAASAARSGARPPRDLEGPRRARQVRSPRAATVQTVSTRPPRTPTISLVRFAHVHAWNG